MTPELDDGVISAPRPIRAVYERINNDGQVRLKVSKGHLCSAQTNLFLDRYQPCQATG